MDLREFLIAVSRLEILLVAVVAALFEPCRAWLNTVVSAPLKGEAKRRRAGKMPFEALGRPAL